MANAFKILSPTQRKSLEFVKTRLSDGKSKAVRELQLEARAEGIPMRSLTFTRKLLGIEVLYDRQRKSYVWSLPAAMN